MANLATFLVFLFCLQFPVALLAIMNASNDTHFCNCEFNVLKSSIECDLSFLNSCHINTSFATILKIKNVEKITLDKIDTLKFDETELIELLLIDVPFLLLKSLTIDRHFFKLTSLFYSQYCESKFDCFQSIKNDFLSNLSISIPNLSTLTINNAGFCGYSSWNDSPSFENFHRLKRLNLQFNNIDNVVPTVPNGLQVLNLSHNQIKRLSFDQSEKISLTIVDLSHNEIVSLDLRAQSIKSLNLSYNSIEALNTQLFNNRSVMIEHLDVSQNQIATMDQFFTRTLPQLSTLILSDNPIKSLNETLYQNTNLRKIVFERNQLDHLDLDKLSGLINLDTLILTNSKLRYISGGLKQLKMLNISRSLIRKLPQDFLTQNPNLNSIDISRNNWSCNCNLAWLNNKWQQLHVHNVNETFCFEANTTIAINMIDFLARSIDNKNETCLFGACMKSGTIVWVHHGDDAILDCDIYGYPFPIVTWYRYGEGCLKILGKSDDFLIQHEKYFVHADGALVIKDVDRYDKGIYACFAENTHGNKTIYLSMRLEYATAWFHIKVNSIACGILTAMAFFALNMIWGALRRLVTWRLSQVHRKGRVRLLIQSLEKYRSRQIENLHEMYASNVNRIHENYNQQVEALRKSYLSQADRFRGYRTVQMEQMATHLDALRENYYAQLSRVRDYGSQRMERVYDGYQRQVTRVRDYSFQQRLRLMRQYKFKQRYLNRILENLNLAQSTDLENGIELKKQIPNAPDPSFLNLHTIEAQINMENIPSTSSLRFPPSRVLFNRSIPELEKIDKTVEESHLARLLARRRSSSDPHLDAWYLKGEKFHSTEAASTSKLDQIEDENINSCFEEALKDTKLGSPDADNDDSELKVRKRSNKKSIADDDIESYHSVTSLDFVFNDRMNSSPTND